MSAPRFASRDIAFRRAVFGLLDGFRPADRGDAGSTRMLAVVLHGWRGSAARMGDVAAAAVEALGGREVDLLVPDLPYRSLFSAADAAEIVAWLLAAVDDVVGRRGPYGRIVLIGHGMGATIARRLYLTAVGPLAAFRAEKPLRREHARAWARDVERIVLIGAFNRGWKLSARVSWSYGILFDLVAVIGHLMPKRDWKPTVFDIRLGAPFMVQTRLHWLAYRRHSDRDRTGPALIQIIGTRDDLISPFDQVDIAVDGLEQDAKAVGGRRRIKDRTLRSYFLVQLADTGHASAIDLHGPRRNATPLDAARRAVAARRRATLIEVLRRDRRGLHAIAVDPDLLSDEVARPNTGVKRVVFVIHGIRDDGFWTHRVAEAIRRAAGVTCGNIATVRSWTPTYGYFAMLPFMLPWIRRGKVEWLMDQYVTARARYPAADFDYVGHSNGTYLGARALRDYADCRFRHVFFAGSVVRSDYRWRPLIAQGRVRRLLNVVATADWVVALLPKSLDWWRAVDLGGAGFDGFRDACTLPELAECRFVAGGHGAGIVEGHWGDIADFVEHGRPFMPRESLPALFGGGQPAWLRGLAKPRLTVAVLAVTLLAVIPFLILHWDRHGPPALSVLILLFYAALVGFVVTRI